MITGFMFWFVVCLVSCAFILCNVLFRRNKRYIMNTVAVRICLNDFVFVLDESGSISSSDFSLVKTFLSRLVDRLDIDSGRTRVGLITFSSSVGTVINLNDHLSVASCQSAITSLSKRGGSSNTARALAYVRTTMLTKKAGARPGVCKKVAVLTDGKSDNSAATLVSVKMYYILYLSYCYSTE